MKVKRWFCLVIAGLSAVLAGCGSVDLFKSDAGEAQNTQPAPLTEGQRFADWRVGCEKINNGDQNNCFIFQTVVNGDTNQPVLQMAVGRSPQNGQLTAILTLPKEVDVKSGIDMNTDARTLTHFGYQRCAEKGCLAGLALDDSLIKQLRAEQGIKIVVSDGKRTIALPISLNGFNDGLNALGVKN
jgi:invasion protein IalB